MKAGGLRPAAAAPAKRLPRDFKRRTPSAFINFLLLIFGGAQRRPQFFEHQTPNRIGSSL
jgi:hypothetical protein